MEKEKIDKPRLFVDMDGTLAVFQYTGKTLRTGIFFKFDTADECGRGSTYAAVAG